MLGLIAATLAGMADHAALTPTGKWMLEQGAAKCIAQRSYARDNGDRLTLQIWAVPFSNSYTVSVIEPGYGGLMPAFKTLRITRGGDEDKPVVVGYWGDRMPHKKAHVWHFKIARRVLGTAAGPTITFTPYEAWPFDSKRPLASERPFAIPTTDLSSAMAGLASCEVGVERQWGIDPATVSAVYRPAVARNSGDWIDDADYPESAVRKAGGGYVIARWKVGTDGRAHDCKVVESTANAQFARGSCAAIEAHAIYTPARNVKDEPIPSWDSATITLVPS